MEKVRDHCFKPQQKGRCVHDFNHKIKMRWTKHLRAVYRDRIRDIGSIRQPRYTTTPQMIINLYYSISHKKNLLPPWRQLNELK